MIEYINKEIILKEIEKMAFDYWNFDILPPVEKWRLVLDYIADHPERFKGLTPQ